MAECTRVCKVCGKEYTYCKTWNTTGAFRYQDVACSPEHGSVYLEMVRKSREVVPDPEPILESDVELEEDEEEEDDLEDDFFGEEPDEDE